MKLKKYKKDYKYQNNYLMYKNYNKKYLLLNKMHKIKLMNY